MIFVCVIVVVVAFVDAVVVVVVVIGGSGGRGGGGGPSANFGHFVLLIEVILRHQCQIWKNVLLLQNNR